MTHPAPVKAHAIALLLTGDTTRYVEKTLGVPRTTLRRWYAEYQPIWAATVGPQVRATGFDWGAIRRSLSHNPQTRATAPNAGVVVGPFCTAHDADDWRATWSGTKQDLTELLLDGLITPAQWSQYMASWQSAGDAREHDRTARPDPRAGAAHPRARAHAAAGMEHRKPEAGDEERATGGAVAEREATRPAAAPGSVN